MTSKTEIEYFDNGGKKQRLRTEKGRISSRTSYDRHGRHVETEHFGADGSPTSHERWEFEVDQQGNWVVMRKSRVAERFGKKEWVPNKVWYRTFRYRGKDEE